MKNKKGVNMKNQVIILVVLCSLTLGARAQGIPASEVPAAVVGALQAKYATATEVKWEKKGDQYKAAYKVGSRSHDLWLDKTGAVQKHKEDFPKKELPAAIVKALEKDFAGYKLDDADKIETEGKVFYQVKLEGKPKRKLLFTAEGVLKENEPD